MHERDDNIKLFKCTTLNLSPLRRLFVMHMQGRRVNVVKNLRKKKRECPSDVYTFGEVVYGTEGDFAVSSPQVLLRFFFLWNKGRRSAEQLFGDPHVLVGESGSTEPGGTLLALWDK